MSTDIEVDMNQSPELFATEHGHKHLVEFHGVEVRVMVLLEAAHTIQIWAENIPLLLMTATQGPLHHATRQALRLRCWPEGPVRHQLNGHRYVLTCS